MSEPARKVSQQAEERLDRVAESVRERFDKITKGRFADKITEGRFADQVDHGIDQGRAETHRDQQDARRPGRGESAA
ncbi:hypothetical protein [Micromonospora okii]|uniref:hypothetical protein n=1 Tax=Micromonospora okii TaxID=1182970 RepID=UPI001E3BE162|nr:hypothetical protein [Micromonospora okii]